MSEAGSKIEAATTAPPAWKPAWDILAERHPRYRELFEADPGTWGPELDRTFANLNPNRQGGRWPGPDNGWVAPPGDGQVTVVISSRNRPEECRRAVESALAQTRRPARVIVVKNGPGGREAYSDALAGLLGGLDGNGVPVVSLLWEPDLSGIAGPINAGLRRASTEYAAILDDDDEWRPNFLEELAGALDSDRSLGLAYCEARHPTDLGPGRVFGHAAPPPNQDFLSAMKSINWFGWSQAVWRRELLAPDYLNPEAGGCADRDAWLRIGQVAGVYHVARLLASHWWHGDNASLDTVWITEGHQWVEQGIKAGRYGVAAETGEPGLPSLARRAVNYAGAQVRHTLDGRQEVDSATQAARLALCEACTGPGGYFRASDRHCAHPSCGCPVDAKTLWRSEACPIGKWSALATEMMAITPPGGGKCGACE
jgi:hypothetical protein